MNTVILQSGRYLLLMKQFISKWEKKEIGEHMKRRVFILCIAIVMVLANAPSVYAYVPENDFAEQDFYIETTISEANDIFEYSVITPRSAEKRITKTKTITGKTKDSKVAWSVSITATFTYDGNTSKCISCSHNAESFVKYWKIKSVSSKRSGNSATASAIMTTSVGGVSKDFKQAVTISCSASGVVS